MPRGPRPTQAQQKQRLLSHFKSLGQRFGIVQADITGIDPEQVIVFETIGSIGDFQRVVRKIPGLEWLGDFETEIAEPDPGFLPDGTDARQLAGRLFVVASNRTAYSKLLKLWRAWCRAADEKLEYGYGALVDVFKHLQDVREWGPKDRIAAGTIESWEAGLASNEPVLRFEAELWCRDDQTKRNTAYGNLRAAVAEAGGQCITQAVIAEIDYHGVLLELPAVAVRQTITAINANNDTRLLRLTDVKYFAPMGQASIMPIGEGNAILAPQKPLPTIDPVAALLDGLPLTNHAALQGRLVIDDPDNFAALYQVGEHRHGTAMASLITHGELDVDETALSSKLYVRPVMHPGRPDIGNQRLEIFPSNALPIDLIHRAVKRIIEGDAGQRPTAPSVKVINLSVGDASQLFDRHLSPWARLLDWLAWKYKILFVISAGNHLHDISLPIPPDSVATASDDDLRSHVLRAMAGQRVQRRLFAPAESVNALTVGALHDQKAPVENPGRLVDLLRGATLPNPINCVASGFRRAIKPEIFVAGGKRHYEPRPAPPGAATTEFRIINGLLQPGQLIAAPGGAAVPPNHAARVSGTSNAAALTTRQAIHLFDDIMALRQEDGGDVLSDDKVAVILKAMLVHGAAWGGWQAFLDHVFDIGDSGNERRHRIKRACGQLLGYGVADFERGTVCTDQRVIVLGCGELKQGEAHLYQLPLPPALSAQTIQRRLTITLAWLTPVNPRHRNYCVADLWFDPPDTQLQITRSEAAHYAVKQGTVQHEILEGQAAVPIAAGDTLPIQVNCREDAANNFTAAIPYALMVSLETGRALPVYDEVRIELEKIRAATRIRPTVRANRN